MGKKIEAKFCNSFYACIDLFWTIMFSSLPKVYLWRQIGGEYGLCVNCYNSDLMFCCNLVYMVQKFGAF